MRLLIALILVDILLLRSLALIGLLRSISLAVFACWLVIAVIIVAHCSDKKRSGFVFLLLLQVATNGFGELAARSRAAEIACASLSLRNYPKHGGLNFVGKGSKTHVS